MVTTDILLDENGDLDFRLGDFLVNESDQQHISDILSSDKGQYREFPLVGAGMKRLLNGVFNSAQIQQDIKLQLEADNYRVNTIRFTNNEIILVDAIRLL